jgi:hypothetical protein
MVGPSEFAALATSLKVALDLARGTKAAIDALDDAEIKFKMAELYSALADAKIALADAGESVAAKDREIERLQHAFRRKEEAVEHNGMPYKRGADGKPQGYPFCPRCLEIEGVLMRALPTMKPGRLVECPECKTDYMAGYIQETVK